ncbi:DUF2235 domain-containing protein [Azohydromonas aeria]|uniref:DUF2235 domain-containing protein n=1 Tax=Azohydromonas aeria TaxID=2590212 RepID=UPI0012F85275|nr:DUF2235 domain-containing protein [Azohydromonas aeria]
MRRLVICADGTWNAPDGDDDDVDVSTNVLKIARTLCPVAEDGVSQIAYYLKGVGTGNALDKAVGGATGRGIDDNIMDCYRFLVHNYTPGDQLYFFGFSRGAYTVRSLAGLIRNSGLLKLQFEGMIGQAYELYRDRDPEKSPTSEAAKIFRNNYAHEGVEIECVGVWDTVGALGVPVGLLNRLLHKRYDFHDTQLSSHIKNAFHALAIDEKRKPFAPTLWQQPVRDKDRNWLEQAWFAGAHSNIGGGYPDTGLSDVAFRWMIERVQDRTRLRFDDNLVNLSTRPKPTGRLVNSMSPAFEVMGRYERMLDAHRASGNSDEFNTWEYVHESVLQRQKELQRDPYRPDNLVAYLRLNPCYVSTRWPANAYQLLE